MKHLVQIDDSSPAGKSLIQLINQISNKFGAVKLISGEKKQLLEDLCFGSIIDEARKNDFVSEKDILKALNNER